MKPDIIFNFFFAAIQKSDAQTDAYIGRNVIKTEFQLVPLHIVDKYTRIRLKWLFRTSDQGQQTSTSTC